MATLTQQQKDLLKTKGISDEQIRKYEKGEIKSSTKDYSGIGSSIANFGKDLGQTLFLEMGGKKEIDNVVQQYISAGDKIFELAKKEINPERKKNLLLQAQSMYDQVGGVGESIIGKVRTNKQIIGDTLGTLGWMVSGGSLGVAKKATTAIGIGKGIIQGAKTGAVAGGVYGGLGGVQSGLSEDKSISEIARRGVTGGISGGITGGILGGVVGGVSGGIQKSIQKAKTKEESFARELAMPKATEKVKQRALKEGRVTEQGLFTGSKIIPSKRDEKTAEVIKGLVSSKKSIVQNIDSVGNKVKDINSGVGAYVKANKRPFNTAQLKTQLNSGKTELKLVFASDKTAQKTYDAVVNEFMKHVAKKDTEGLFLARQSVDKIPAIKKLLDSRAVGENAKKEIVLTIRDKANNYIANLLPKGNQYREALKNESKMINAIINMAEKNTKIIGRSKLIELTEEYPILKWLVGGLATGITGLAGIGVGNVILKSTD